MDAELVVHVDHAVRRVAGAELPRLAAADPVPRGRLAVALLPAAEAAELLPEVGHVDRRVLAAELPPPGALRAVRRPLRAALHRALLPVDVHHLAKGVLRAELPVVAPPRPVRRVLLAALAGALGPVDDVDHVRLRVAGAEEPAGAAGEGAARYRLALRHDAPGARHCAAVRCVALARQFSFFRRGACSTRTSEPLSEKAK